MSDIQQDVYVGKRGEVVIPAGVRREVGLGYGSELVLTLKNGSINLVPKDFNRFKDKWQNRVKTTTKTLPEDGSDQRREKFLQNILEN